MSTGTHPAAAREHQVAASDLFHVGNLDATRDRPFFSWEGSALSVSKHPHDWARLAQTDGTIYRVSPPGPDRYLYDAVVGSPRDAVIEWSVDAEYLMPATAYEVTRHQDSPHQSTTRLRFYSREIARRQLGERADSELCEVDTVTLGPAGRDYWETAFRKPVKEAEPFEVEGLAPLWYAAAHNFDGVWWAEEYAPDEYSAPRGALFQAALEDWTITATGSV